MRQIVLDTETTGLEVGQGHRIIEIGCVELFNRKLTGNHYHCYINPERDVEQGAMEVHGITDQFLSDKPVFSLVAQDFVDFVGDAELIIHNAPFDIGFLNSELLRLERGYNPVDDICSVIDTLIMARRKHPGQRNNLDALCQRYGVDNSQRDLHGALLDAEILADVYLTMTGGQTALQLSDIAANDNGDGGDQIRRLPDTRERLPVICAAADEMLAHEAQLDMIAGKSEGRVLWRELIEQ